MPTTRSIRSQQRQDCYIHNDSAGFSVLAGAALDRAIDGRWDVGRELAHERRVLLLSLEGDDSFPCRIVVDGGLSEQERREWMARVSWPLEVTDGRILVAGGFDPGVFRGFRDGDDDFVGAVHACDVPNGTWLVDVYTHRPTISGRFLDEAWPEPLGAWFRREHPGEPFPAWMARELRLSPELDPGYEPLWSDFRGSLAAGRVRIDPEADSAIGYLVHLHPLDPGARLTALPDDGWFGSKSGARVPPACPTGLLTPVGRDGDDL